MTENAETQETKNLRAQLRTMTEARDELRIRVVMAEGFMTEKQLEEYQREVDLYRLA